MAVRAPDTPESRWNAPELCSHAQPVVLGHARTHARLKARLHPHNHPAPNDCACDFPGARARPPGRLGARAALECSAGISRRIR